MDDSYTKMVKIFCESIAYKSPLLPADWADKYRILSLSSSSEPGQWSTDRTPYLREIMNCLSPVEPYNHIRRVVVMKGHQIGYTEGVLMNGLGYVVAEDPGPTMLVAPTEKAVRKMLQQKIEPMINDSPVVRKRIPTISRFTSRNTIIHKDFPGGFMVLAGANVANDLAGTSVRNLFLDEVDRMGLDTGGEGNPVELAIGRTSAYARKKIIMGSTPVSEDDSIIWKYFKEGDKRYYFVPCPLCGHKQTFEIERLKRRDDGRMVMVCEECGGDMDESQKTLMLEGGEWRATAECDPSYRSYHLNSLYSPLGFLSWDAVEKSRIRAEEDDSFSQTFQNIYLGLPVKEKSEKYPDPKLLFERYQGSYEKGDPPPVEHLLVTAAVDVQADRLEVLVVGWDVTRAYIIDHHVIRGDTSNDFYAPPWANLNVALQRYWADRPIHMMVIDCGYAPHRVFSWLKRCPQQARVRAIRGMENAVTVVGDPHYMSVTFDGRTYKEGNKYYGLNVDYLKGEVHARFLIEDESNSCYIHAPDGLGREFYEQICAEKKKLVRTAQDPSGLRGKYAWSKTRHRNEALDLMAYSIGAWHMCSPEDFLNEWPRFVKVYDHLAKRASS